MKIMYVVCGILLGISLVTGKKLREEREKERKTETAFLKFKEYYELLDQWMMNREQGMHTANYFIKNSYKTVAIYGMGQMGNHLYEELIDSKEVDVIYAIDKKGTSVFPELCVKKPTEELPSVDAVVITVLNSYSSIVSMLEEKMHSSMISLEEVICES